MAGSVVNATSVASATTSLSCAMPTGTVQGDVMVAAVAADWDTHANVTAPAGWTLRTGQDGGTNNIHLKVFTKTAGVSEAGPYAFTQGASSDGTAAIVTLRGVDESTAAGLYSSTLTVTTSTTRTAPTITGATTGAVLVCGAMTDGGGVSNAWTAPGGMTEQADVQSSAFTSESIATLLAPSSPSGTKDFTCANTPPAVGGIQWSAVFNASGATAADPPPLPARGPGLFRSPGVQFPQPWFGVADTAAATPSSAEQGLGGVGLAATGTAVKIAVVAGTCTVGAVASGTAKKAAPAAGRAAAGLAVTSLDRKVQAHTGVGSVGLAGAGVDKKVAREASAAALGLASTAVDKKAAVETGASNVGLSATGGASASAARPQTGTSAIGLAGTGTPRKIGVGRGSAATGLAGTGAGKKLTALSGATALGVTAVGAAKKVAPHTGRVTTGIAATGAATKRAPHTGTSTVGVTGTGGISVWGPPPGLTATPISTTQIDLAWTAVALASGYDIERDGIVIASGVVGTTYSDTGLTANTLYSYRARSIHV